MTKDINELWADFRRRWDALEIQNFESQLQSLLQDYPTEALERILAWARHGWLGDDWGHLWQASVSQRDGFRARRGVVGESRAGGATFPYRNKKHEHSDSLTL